MAIAPFSIALGLSSAAHQKDLPEALARRGILLRAVRFGAEVEILEPDGAGVRVVRRFASYRLASRAVWAIWRRLPGVGPMPAPLIRLAWAADRITARSLPRCGVFHGLMGACLANIVRARRMGAVTLLDHPTLHPRAWQREVLAECAATGLRPRDCERSIPPMLFGRLEREYEACDRIVVYSSAAARSFDGFPYAAKTVVATPGVDHRLFAPAPAPRRDGVFRVCYVGRIEAAKGLHYLAEAWRRLRLERAELVLAGRVLPEMEGLASQDGIRLAGILAPAVVAEILRESDLFVYPSVNEGLPLAALEAMSSGLPVVACRDSWAEDCVTPGSTGLLAPAHSAEGLAEAILWCRNHPDELAVMGAAARARVEKEFQLSHYVERLVAAYSGGGLRAPG
jgi:glycosyltransferase involved in cell wall biosynthesis